MCCEKDLSTENNAKLIFFRAKVRAGLSIGCLIVATVVAIISLFLPPVGQISSSVLVLIANFLVIVGGYLGLTIATDIKELNLKLRGLVETKKNSEIHKNSD